MTFIGAQSQAIEWRNGFFNSVVMLTCPFMLMLMRMQQLMRKDGNHQTDHEEQSFYAHQKIHKAKVVKKLRDGMVGEGLML